MIPSIKQDTMAFSDSFNKQREQMHRQMMSCVSHDLKTPLASVIGSLEIYERMKDKLTLENKQALITMALQEAYRLDNFITNILDMAKLENEQVKIRRELCDIGGLVQDCVIQLSSRLKDSNVVVKSMSGILAVTTDAMLMQRALGLLVDNAVKYGGTPSAIELEYGRGERAQAFIRVRDHGPGVPDIKRDAIFSKYTRFGKQDTQNAGTGLGLAICRTIMKLLDGTVTVENHADGGAVFTMQFPAG
jgi:K+-sensing histidine kinase KdpD